MRTVRSIYVAAPYEDAPKVVEIHVRLRRAGLVPTSSWAEAAMGPEDFSRYSECELRRIAEHNDSDVFRSDAMIVLARPGAGGEMFAEARYAIVLGKPVFWIGRRTLSAWRSGVERCEDLDHALSIICSGAVAV